MHKMDFRQYLGAPGESASIVASPSGSGSTRFTLDGVDLGVRTSHVFNLSATPGARHRLAVDLFGANGEVCRIDVTTVDGGVDSSVLAIVAPFPHRRGEWDFLVGDAGAVSLMAPMAVRATSRKASRKKAKKGGRK